MKKALFFAILVLIAEGCARSDYVGSAEFRGREYEIGTIALSPKGLTPEQIRTITSTTLPKSYPVDFSIIIVKDRHVTSDTEFLFISNIVKELQKSDRIARVAPIPKLIFPDELNFTSIARSSTSRIFSIRMRGKKRRTRSSPTRARLSESCW